MIDLLNYAMKNWMQFLCSFQLRSVAHQSRSRALNIHCLLLLPPLPACCVVPSYINPRGLQVLLTQPRCHKNTSNVSLQPRYGSITAYPKHSKMLSRTAWAFNEQHLPLKGSYRWGGNFPWQSIWSFAMYFSEDELGSCWGARQGSMVIKSYWWWWRWIYLLYKYIELNLTELTNHIQNDNS